MEIAPRYPYLATVLSLNGTTDQAVYVNLVAIGRRLSVACSESPSPAAFRPRTWCDCVIHLQLIFLPGNDQTEATERRARSPPFPFLTRLIRDEFGDLIRQNTEKNFE